MRDDAVHETTGDEVRLRSLEGLIEDELLEWYLMTPKERWIESQRLWATFELLGGRREPQPDSQSPFDLPGEPGPGSSDGGAGLHSVRRSGV
jgi:hypothetical protein